MSRRRPQPPSAVRPNTPCGIDLGGERTWVVELEGSRKAALETGRTRLLVAGLVFALAFLVVAGRLVDLAMLSGAAEPRVASLGGGAEGWQTTRADIVDRNGEVLATLLPTASLYANPRQIRDPQATAEALQRVLPEIGLAKLHADLSADRGFVYIKRGLTPRETAAINRLGLPGLHFQREERRFYPHGSLVSHVVGYTDIDNRGLAGVECSFDELLRGGGAPLQLSIDLRLQHILAEELAESMHRFRGVAAAGLVLDADSGEVLAMVSLPDFEPRRIGDADDDQLRNWATLGVYEMGSVFKIFTTAMALDAGVVGLRDGYDTSQPIRVARYTIRDFKPKNRWLSVPEIFMYSSNIGTVHMAMAAGTERQQQFFGDLGLLRPPSLELPELGRPLPPRPWREINTMTASYGHGIAVTPLQVARAVAAVVNGGTLPSTTLVKRAPGEAAPGPRVLRESTSEQMRWLMRLVVANGTGRKAEAPGYLVGGKTGTADKLDEQTGRYARDKRIASFVGAFPMTDPRYVIFAMVDEPKPTPESHNYATGGWVAAPVVSHTVARMAPLLGLAPDDEPHDAFERLRVPARLGGNGLATR